MFCCYIIHCPELTFSLIIFFLSHNKIKAERHESNIIASFTNKRIVVKSTEITCLQLVLGNFYTCMNIRGNNN